MSYKIKDNKNKQMIKNVVYLFDENYTYKWIFRYFSILFRSST